MTKLSININKVATLRNTRSIGIPSVVLAARICLDAGAHGITVHPRPDQRHIRPDDVRELADLLKKYPGAEFNIEGNPFHQYQEIIDEIHPTQCTLVPDAPDAPTSDHGWEFPQDARRLGPVVGKLKRSGSRVSLFMDARPDAIESAAGLQADRIELYTAPFAEEFERGETGILEPFATTARRAQNLGMGVNAGHDLNLHNLRPFLEGVPNILEVSIGHALIADALEFGLEKTVKKYLACIN